MAMAVSNKKKKAILRGFPKRSVDELAQDLGISKREVKAVLKDAGKLTSAINKKAVVIAAAAALSIAVVSLVAYVIFFKPGAGKLARLEGELNVLFVTIDTCRADRIGAYGYKPAETPVIDAVAASGARFENAFAIQPLTLPSHATIFTGLHPAAHGLADNGLFRLPDKAATMAEALKERGYTTAAIVSSFVLHRQFGTHQGFDHYDDGLSAHRNEIFAGFDEMPAVVVSDRGLEWLDRHGDEKWFLWLHYFDPHAGYNPPPPFDQGFPHPYDGEVAYVDAELGRIMRALDQKGLREKTLVVITSDHGEGLGEHGESSHGMFLYDTTQHVPLIFSLPGVIPAGRVSEQLVTLMDLMPTVLEAAGAKVPASAQGRSILGLVFKDREGWEDKPVVGETAAPWHQYGWSPTYFIRDLGFKFIDAPAPELYDLEADPGEENNVYSQNRGRAETMARALKQARSEYAATAFDGAGGERMDEETRARLASLGYIHDGTEPRPPEKGAPDPKAMKDVLEWMNQAAIHENKGEHQQAADILEKVLVRSPGHRRALNRLGTAHYNMRNYQTAEKYLKELIEIDPNFYEAYVNLGAIYAKQRKIDQLRMMAEAVLALYPDSANGYLLLGLVGFHEKDYTTAIKHYKNAIELFPTMERAYGNLGLAYYRIGDHDRAIEAYQNALRLNPNNAGQEVTRSRPSGKSEMIGVVDDETIHRIHGPGKALR